MEQTNLIVAVLAALEQQIKAIVTEQVAAALAAQPKQEATPSTPATQTIDVPAFIDTLDKQEWFWSKMQTFVEKELDSQIEQAIDAHCSDYDHEEYDSIVRHLNDYDLDYFVTQDDIGAKVEEAVDERLDDKIEDKARELLRNASISIDV